MQSWKIKIYLVIFKKDHTCLTDMSNIVALHIYNGRPCLKYFFPSSPQGDRSPAEVSTILTD